MHQSFETLMLHPEAPDVHALARAIRAELLLHDPELLDAYRNAPPRARKAAQEVLLAFAERLAQAGPHAPLAMFLAELVTTEEPTEWRAVVPQLLASVRADLTELVRDALARHRRSDLTPDATIHLSLERVTYACARYLSGVSRVWPTPIATFELPFPASHASMPSLRVHVRTPDRPREAPSSAELRVKTLLLLLSVAATAPQATRDERYVRFADVLRVFGYQAGTRANTRSYWRHFQQVARATLIDLPAHDVHLGNHHVVPLLHVLQFVHRDPSTADDDRTRETLRDVHATPDALRALGLIGVRYRFDSALLTLLWGTEADEARSKVVPTDFCALRGPSFWLAWRVTAESNGPHDRNPRGVTNTLWNVLRETGYVPGGKVGRYKQAVRTWWHDVGLLVDLGLLEEPGVRLYRSSEPGARECSDQVSRLLDTSGVHLRADDLARIHVRFVHAQD